MVCLSKRDNNLDLDTTANSCSVVVLRWEMRKALVLQMIAQRDADQQHQNKRLIEHTLALRCTPPVLSQIKSILCKNWCTHFDDTLVARPWCVHHVVGTKVNKDACCSGSMHPSLWKQSPALQCQPMTCVCDYSSCTFLLQHKYSRMNG